MIYQPFVTGPEPGNDSYQLGFLNMYINWLDPRAQNLMAMPPNLTRYNDCISLAASTGLFLDLNIVGQGWDPLFTMSFRQATCGYIWTPSCLQQTPQDPTQMQSGPIPAGAMKVSLDSNDYPAFVIPGPVFDPAVPWVGPNIVGVLYNSTPAAKALQQSATPIPAGYPHSEEINGELKRFVAQVPPGQPNNLTWLMQGI